MDSMKRLMDLEGNGIRERLRTSISYEEADVFDDSLYTVMAMTGYLKAVPEGNSLFRLSIPNSEIRIMIAARMESLVRFDSGSYQDFCNAVLEGRIDDIEMILGKILRQGSYWNLRRTQSQHYTGPRPLSTRFLMDIDADPSFRTISCSEPL